jgi:hypothetical protein
MTTKIIPCACKHEFQDKEYGAGMRVANKLAQKAGVNEYRCTVCSKVHSKATGNTK